MIKTTIVLQCIGTSIKAIQNVSKPGLEIQVSITLK